MTIRITVFAQTFSLVCLCLLLGMNSSFSQESNFIEPVPDRDIPDSQEIRDYKLRLGRNPNIAKFQFIKLNALATSQQDGILKLRRPNTTSLVTAEATHVEYHDEPKL